MAFISPLLPESPFSSQKTDIQIPHRDEFGLPFLPQMAIQLAKKNWEKFLEFKKRYLGHTILCCTDRRGTHQLTPIRKTYPIVVDGDLRPEGVILKMAKQSSGDETTAFRRYSLLTIKHNQFARLSVSLGFGTDGIPRFTVSVFRH